MRNFRTTGLKKKNNIVRSNRNRARCSEESCPRSACNMYKIYVYICYKSRVIGICSMNSYRATSSGTKVCTIVTPVQAEQGR